jgi:hypothetical protein
MKRDNWYIALDLNLSPPEKDHKVIEQRLSEKRKFWSSNINDPEMGAYYQYWLDQAPKMLKRFEDPDEQKKMAEEAEVEVFGFVDEMIDAVSGKMSQEQIEKIARHAKTDVSEIEKRIAYKGVKISCGNAPTALMSTEEIYKEYYIDEHSSRFRKFKNGKNELSAAGAVTYYQLLFGGKNPEELTRSELWNKADELKRAITKGDPKLKSKKKAIADARSIFESDESRKEYDAYLAHQARKKVIPQIIGKIDLKYNAACPPNACEQFIREITPYMEGNPNAATDLFVAICEMNGFSYEVEAKSSASFFICQCGNTIDTSQGQKKCPKCGRDLPPPDFSNVSNAEFARDEMHVTFNWPPNVNVAVVSINKESAPVSPLEPGVTNYRITKQEYDTLHFAVIKEVGKDNFRATIFAEYDVGAEKIYSAGIKIPGTIRSKAKAAYTLNTRTSLLGELKALEVVVNTEARLSKFPDFQIVCREDRLPLTPSDGMLLYENTSMTSGNGRFEITNPPTGYSQIYYRLFFKEEESYEFFEPVQKNAAPIKLKRR